jgi:hypothetical protein
MKEFESDASMLNLNKDVFVVRMLCDTAPRIQNIISKTFRVFENDVKKLL